MTAGPDLFLFCNFEARRGVRARNRQNDWLSYRVALVLFRSLRRRADPSARRKSFLSEWPESFPCLFRSGRTGPCPCGLARTKGKNPRKRLGRSIRRIDLPISRIRHSSTLTFQQVIVTCCTVRPLSRKERFGICRNDAICSFRDAGCAP